MLALALHANAESMAACAVLSCIYLDLFRRSRFTRCVIASTSHWHPVLYAFEQPKYFVPSIVFKSQTLGSIVRLGLRKSDQLSSQGVRRQSNREVRRQQVVARLRRQHGLLQFYVYNKVDNVRKPCVESAHI